MRVVLGVVAIVVLVACGDEANQPPPANPSTPPASSYPCAASADGEVCRCPAPAGDTDVVATSLCQAPAGLPGFCWQNNEACYCEPAGCVAGSSTCLCSHGLRGQETCSSEGAHCCMDPTATPSRCLCVYGVKNHACARGQTEVPSCGVADLRVLAQMKGRKVVGACRPYVP
jgi:hypothetical protein